MKTISVMTNDPAKLESIITVSGNVEKFITVTPPVIRLNGKIGDNLKSVVQIIPESKYQFSVTKISAQDGKNIKYELKENKSATGSKEYSIAVENVKKDAGYYNDVLILQTDSKIQSEVKINVIGRIIDPNAPVAKAPPPAPITGNNGINGAGINGAGVNGAEVKNGVQGNSFIEAIQKMQQNQKTQQNDPNAQPQTLQTPPMQDSKHSEELKKKFETLIKQAQEKQKAQAEEENTKPSGSNIK